jgi:predicted metalloendopeptidase
VATRMPPPLKRRLRCPTKPSVPPLSHTKQPGNGFYEYVNQSWLKSHDVAKWRSEFGVSDEIEDETNKDLLKILYDLKYSDTKSLTPKTSEDHLALMIHIWKTRSVEAEEAYLKICLHQL